MIGKFYRKKKAHMFVLRRAYISASNSVFCLSNLGAWEFPKLKDRGKTQGGGGGGMLTNGWRIGTQSHIMGVRC